MKRLSLLAALVAAAIAVPLSSGSSHREAPNIMLDPAADNTDTYAFTAKDKPGALTIAANWIPGQVPANGPNFFRFDDRALYYVNLDNTGDGRADIRYRYTFRTRVGLKDSFTHSKPEVTSLDDPDLSQRQTYDVVREEYRRGKLKDEDRIVNDLPVVPSNVGEKTMPDYRQLSREGVQRLPGGGRVFTGQRDEPFFIDLGATFDSINLRVPPGNVGGGKDDFSGQNTNSIVMQLPERKVTKNGRQVPSADAGNAVVGVWASTERRRLEVTNADYSAKRATSSSDDKFVQVSRLGNPLFNELFQPVKRKDLYNRTTPRRDGKRFGREVREPELARLINEFFPGLFNAPEENRGDLVMALLQGIPGLNRHPNQGDDPPRVDTLKINLGIPPTDTPNRFGLIGGDKAGYPNGRRLEDDIVDIQVRLVAGFLKGNKQPLGDGVVRNDKDFLSEFPYLAEPDSGFRSDPSNRTEPPQPPDPPDPDPTDGL